MKSVAVLLVVLLSAVIGSSSSESQPQLRGRGVRTSYNTITNEKNAELSNTETSTDLVDQDEHQPHQQSRDLQVVTQVLNAVISVVTPAVSDKIRYVVSTYYNEYDFQWLEETGFSRNHKLGHSIARESTNDTAVCSGSDFDVDVNFELNTVEGAGALTVDKIAFVDGSQNIDLIVKGFKNGATWSGEWIVDVSIPELVANTTISFNASCGGDMLYEEEQSFNGTMILRSIVASSIATIRGDTDRVFLFPTTSQLVAATVSNLTISYQEMDTSNLFGDTPTDQLNFDANAVVTALFDQYDVHQQLDAYFSRIYTKAIQEEVDWILPRPLIGIGR